MLIYNKPDAKVISNEDLEDPDLEDMPYLAVLFFPTGGSSLTPNHKTALQLFVDMSTTVGDDYYYDAHAMASRLGNQQSNQQLSERRLESGLIGLSDAGADFARLTKINATGEDTAELLGVPDGDNGQIWRSFQVGLFTTDPAYYTARLRKQKKMNAVRCAGA